MPRKPARPPVLLLCKRQGCGLPISTRAAEGGTCRCPAGHSNKVRKGARQNQAALEVAALEVEALEADRRARRRERAAARRRAQADARTMHLPSMVMLHGLPLNPGPFTGHEVRCVFPVLEGGRFADWCDALASWAYWPTDAREHPAPRLTYDPTAPGYPGCGAHLGMLHAARRDCPDPGLAPQLAEPASTPEVLDEPAPSGPSWGELLGALGSLVVGQLERRHPAPRAAALEALEPESERGWTVTVDGHPPTP